MGKEFDLFRHFRNRHVTVVSGMFFPDGTSAIDNTLNEGFGWSVAYASNKFTITLDKVYKSLQSFRLGLQTPASSKDFTIELGDVDLASKTIEIRIVKKSDGSNTVFGSYDANQSVSFEFDLKETSSN